MKKIFIRSPYFIEVDELDQTSAKIEVFLWNKGTTEPATPNYTFTKQVPSLTQTKLSWNVSNLAKEFIKPISPVIVSVPTEENVNTWCYMKVKRYSDDVLLDTETFVCLNGYTQYLDGYNQSTTDTIVPLFNTSIKNYVKDFTTDYVSFFLEVENYDTSYDYVDVTEPAIWKFPILQATENVEESFFYAEELCEPKYTPITCTFINRFGGWQYLTFFKANTQSIDVTSKDFNLLPTSLDYNVLKGQKQRFSIQGKQKIKCNTGWVDENYSELIQDLLLSEVVLLDNKPAMIKSQSTDLKTYLKEKNINYEIEFEFNYGLINDVI
jgi:hypothetical protein